MNRYWYRVYDVQYASSVDEDGTAFGPGRLAIETMRLNVLKTTPKGVWLDYGGKRFVRLNAKKAVCVSDTGGGKDFISSKKTAPDQNPYCPAQSCKAGIKAGRG